MWIVLASVTDVIERYRGNDLLNEPSLIICYAIPTMGVLCSLTVGCDKIDQSRLKRIVGNLITSGIQDANTYPIGSTVGQVFRCLVEEESLAAVVLQRDCIIGL